MTSDKILFLFTGLVSLISGLLILFAFMYNNQHLTQLEILFKLYPELFGIAFLVFGGVFLIDRSGKLN